MLLSRVLSVEGIVWCPLAICAMNDNAPMELDGGEPPEPPVFVPFQGPAESIADSGCQSVEDQRQLHSTAVKGDLDKFCNKVQAGVQEALAKYGGPDAFLRARFVEKRELQGWLDFLDTLQDSSVANYSLDCSLPVSNVQELSKVWFSFILTATFTGYR